MLALMKIKYKSVGIKALSPEDIHIQMCKPCTCQKFDIQKEMNHLFLQNDENERKKKRPQRGAIPFLRGTGGLGKAIINGSAISKSAIYSPHC